MTITGRIRRVWPGRGQRAQIIVTVPQERFQYGTTADGKLVGGQPTVVTERAREDCYVWMTSVEGQLVATLCKVAEHSKETVILDGDETAWGFLVKAVTFPKEQTA